MQMELDILSIDLKDNFLYKKEYLHLYAHSKFYTLVGYDALGAVKTLCILFISEH